MLQRRKAVRRFVGVFAAVTALFMGYAAAPGYAAGPKPGAAVGKAAVSKQVYADLAADGSAAFLVYLRDRADLSGAQKVADRASRAKQVYQKLRGTAEGSQSGLRGLLTGRKAQFKPFWIANAVWVKGDRALLDTIAVRSDVERVEPSKSYRLIKPAARAAASAAAPDTAEWNVTNVGAPRVWSEFGDRGEGIVVANIDSGVQFDHPALVNQYRGNRGDGTFDHNYNWFDPAHVCSDPAPCDDEEHGTHVMGTMLGDDGAGNQTGVAPGAKWITARGCEDLNCTDASLLASGQWVLAPTDLSGGNPRPELHPDIVNNSWGGDPGDPWYQQTVRAWVAAGIFPVFSSGNEGPNCGSAGSPGDYAEAYSVGAYNSNGDIASFSGRGASAIDGGVKPNISAPGVAVRSSVPNNRYASYNGTSMAAPHVSGTVALLWSVAPSLVGDVTATRDLLDDTATDVDATSCGGTADDNNTFGEGRLDAYQAVVASPRGASGRVAGAVTDAANGNPIAGATVSVGGRSTTTGPDGRFAVTVVAGTHEVTASRYGYATQTATVDVPEGGAVTRDFALRATPLVTVRGKVTDGSGHGWPLYARLSVAGRPGGPIFTNPTTGEYAFQVAGEATYSVSVTALYPGYQTVTRNITVAGSDVTADIAVPVAAASCAAPGYRSSFGSPVLTESFDSQSTPDGWSVVERTAGGGWDFDDPGGRGNQTGGSGGFAILDSDALGSGNTQDSDLVTPALDFSGMAAPYLRFNSDYRAFSNSTADVDVSTDGGTTWVNVWHHTTTDQRSQPEEISLAPAAGSAQARVRFRYQGRWAWWWQVDDVQVSERACTPVPGGLVVGFTTDANTGAGLNQVTVSSVDAPAEQTHSAATPDDPNIGDGFYWLFSSVTGAHPFTASRSPYQSLTKTVTVAASNTRRADFALKAGRLSISPTSVRAVQPYNSARSTTVTVTNTGSAPVDVQVVERAGGFTELRRSTGAALKKVTGKFRDTRDGVSGTRRATGPGTAAIGDAWETIANYSADVFDNSAVTHDGKVYSFGGGSGSGQEKKAWVYDPGTDGWSPLPDLPTARSKPAAAVVGGKIYVIGGWGAGDDMAATVDVLDPATGTWATLSSTNPTPTAGAGVAVAGGKIYLVGGCLNGDCDKGAQTVVFDPASGSFQSAANYPQPVGWISCGGISGQVYCAGGSGEGGSFQDGYVYDPAGGVWSALPALPLDLWGSQYSAAGGLLVISGGVTDGSTAITNQTVAYDPVAGSWLTLPNAQFERYRGAGACGAYKIGGSPESFVGSPESERLTGLDLCADNTDVPWLSEAPATFTLAAGASKKVKVTLTAKPANGITQPGSYTAELGLVAATPYASPSVPVQMTVTPPASWGRIEGRVQGRSCSGDLSGVPAIVRINPVANPDAGYTVQAGRDGRYGYWVPKNRYEIIVAKDFWVPQTRRTQVQPGIVQQQDFTLTPVSPCPAAASRPMFD